MSVMNFFSNLFASNVKVPSFNVIECLPDPNVVLTQHIVVKEPEKLDVWDQAIKEKQPSGGRHFREAFYRIHETAHLDEPSISKVCAVKFFVNGFNLLDTPEMSVMASMAGATVYNMPRLHKECATHVANTANQLLMNKDRLNAALFVGMVGTAYGDQDLLSKAQKIYEINATTASKPYPVAAANFTARNLTMA